MNCHSPAAPAEERAAVEAVSRADVLEGQLAEATEQLAEVSTRARTLAESLAMRAQARC